MRKSKLELYEEILKSLKNNPFTVDCLSYETGIDCASLRQGLAFLTQNGLVREKALKRGTIFTVSERGSAVLKALGVQKRLEKVKKAIIAVDRRMQAEVTVPKRQRKNK